MARAEGGGVGYAGDGMGRAGWKTRGEGHRGMRVIEMSMEGHMPSRQLGTLESNFMGGLGRTGQAVDDSKRRLVATRVEIHLDSPRSASC